MTLIRRPGPMAEIVSLRDAMERLFDDRVFRPMWPMGTEREAVLGILDVNGWHNLVHIASGVLGLAVLGSYPAARGYAFGLGAIYLVITLLGFAAGDGGEILRIVPVNTEDNVLHLLIGFAGIAAGFATPASPAPSTASA